MYQTLMLRFRTSQVALAVIVLTGLLLRLFYLVGLHFADDPDYARRAYYLLEWGIHLYPDLLGTRIGTWYPAALTYRLFGVSDLGLIAYPLLMSIVAIPVIYLLALRLFDTRAAIVAALLLAWYPLDVELSTRLLPDALLSAFSLFAFYLLLTADIANQERQDGVLSKRAAYVASGILFGWCTLINMSAAVILVGLGAYLLFSLTFSSFRHTLRTALLRPLLILAGFAVVVGLEGFLYYRQFGSWLFKFVATLAHYNTEGGSFYQDLWFYPRVMWFIGQDFRVALPPAEYRPYGFYFLIAAPAVIYALCAKDQQLRTAAIWYVAMSCYLQWGTMSLQEWNLLHRLDRHLAMVTPPMILILSGATSHLVRYRGGTTLAVVVLAFLIVTSFQTIRDRHVKLERERSPMWPVRHFLELHRPKNVFMDTQTIAFQAFLDKYQDRGRRYHDITTVSQQRLDDMVAVVLSDNNFPTPLPGGIDLHNPPTTWQLLADVDIVIAPGLVKWIRAYRVNNASIADLDFDGVRQPSWNGRK